MKVHVTQDHINRGIKKDNALCPVALAVQDAGVQSICGFSASVLKFTHRFDNGEPVQPFEFEVYP